MYMLIYENEYSLWLSVFSINVSTLIKKKFEFQNTQGILMLLAKTTLNVELLVSN